MTFGVNTLIILTDYETLLIISVYTGLAEHIAINALYMYIIFCVYLTSDNFINVII